MNPVKHMFMAYASLDVGVPKQAPRLPKHAGGRFHGEDRRIFFPLDHLPVFVTVAPIN